MNLALKNIVVNLGQSLSSHCFTATLWVDGKPTFDVQDEGFGEPMLYTALPTAKLEISDLLKQIQPPVSDKLASQSHYQHLDETITAMVDAHLVTLKTKHQLRRITFVHEQQLYELSNSRARDELAIARLKQSPWWTANHTLVNELPFDEASALLLSYQFRVTGFKLDGSHAP